MRTESRIEWPPTLDVSIFLDSARPPIPFRHRRSASGRGSRCFRGPGDAKVTVIPSAIQRTAVLYRSAQRLADHLRGLASLEPPRIDFLLPHGTWAGPTAPDCT